MVAERVVAKEDVFYEMASLILLETIYFFLSQLSCIANRASRLSKKYKLLNSERQHFGG